MAKELFYLPSYKNVGELFQKIASAKQPEAFTTMFLSETLGLKSSADRSLITLLKALGFLDSTSRPTKEYGALKNPSQAKRAIGRAIRRAYEPLFAANEKVHVLQGTELRGLVAQVAGSDSGTTSKIVGTFSALVRLADLAPTSDESSEDQEEEPEEPTDETPADTTRAFAALRPEFHYNIQIHLPANAPEETYLNIFKALRKAFK